MSAGCSCEDCRKLPPHPAAPGKHTDPKTGIFPVHEWGPECGRGIPNDAWWNRLEERLWWMDREPPTSA
jgi:hypothetical protein